MKKLILAISLLGLNSVYSQTDDVKVSIDNIKLVFTADSKLENIKKNQIFIKNEFNVDLDFKIIKKNQEGKITGIEISYDDNNGNSGNKKISGSEPIKPISFTYSKDKNGIINISLANEDTSKVSYVVSDFKYAEDEKREDENINIKPKSYSKSIKIIKDKDGNVKKSIVENGKEIEEEFLKITDGLGEKFNFDLDFDKLMQGKSFNFSFENLDKINEKLPSMEKLQEEMEKMKEDLEKMKAEMQNNKKEFKETKKI